MFPPQKLHDAYALARLQDAAYASYYGDTTTNKVSCRSIFGPARYVSTARKSFAGSYNVVIKIVTTENKSFEK